MNVPTQQAMRNAIRSVAAVVSCTLLFNQFTHAAKLPAALSQAAQQPAPIEHQAPADASTPPQTAATPEALARGRLLAAHNVYIVNDGGDRQFPVDPAESQVRFASVMQSWGRFHIVNTLREADLVLQLRSAVTESVLDSTDNTGSTVTYTPQFRLMIADPETLKPLWTITVPVLTGIRGKDHADRFTISADTLVSQLKLLVGEPLTKQELADLKYPSRRAHRLLWIGIGGLAATATIGLVLLLRAKHNGEQQQQDFCKQHNIVPCPV